MMEKHYINDRGVLYTSIYMKVSNNKKEVVMKRALDKKVCTFDYKQFRTFQRA